MGVIERYRSRTSSPARRVTRNIVERIPVLVRSSVGSGPLARARASVSFRLNAAEAFLKASQGNDRRNLASGQRGDPSILCLLPARSPSEALSADFPSPADPPPPDTFGVEGEGPPPWPRARASRGA